MIFSFRRLRGTFVFAVNAFSGMTEKNENTPVGRVYDIICDAKNLKICAFWIKTPFGLRVLKIEDVKHWNRLEIHGGEWENFFEPDAVPGLDAVFNHEKKILKANVYELDQLIGQVVNFSVNSGTRFVESLVVRKRFSFFGKSRLIGRRQIIRMDDNGIYVKAPTSTVRIVSEQSTAVQTSLSPQETVAGKQGD
jgi:hypothetical protein